MTDDHAPEGRTAHECFELARIALDQAEQVLNRATTTLECDKATASAAISRGWSALGDALANEPRESPHATLVVNPIVRTPPRLDEAGPKHTHNRLTCHHQWIRPTEPCANGCGTSTREAPSYCPRTCPDVSA